MDREEGLDNAREGEHPDRDDHRRAMIADRRCVVTLDTLSAGPDVTG